MNYYLTKPYNSAYQISNTEQFDKEVLSWNTKINQILNSYDQQILDDNYKIIDKKSKRKYDSLQDIQLKKKVLCNHHTKEIDKVITKRREFAISELFNKGLYTYKVDGVRIPLNHNWTNILVMLSGGADSASLAFTLCTLIQRHKLKIKVNIVSGVRVWKSRPWGADVSEEVFNWLRKRFPKIIGERHTIFVPPYFEHSNLGNAFDGRPGEAVILGEYVEYLCNTKKYNAVYNATTQNPIADHHDRMTDRDEDSAEILCSAHENYWKLGPLKTTKKDWVIRQYSIHGILDLLRTTRSCEGDAYLVDSMYGLDWQWYEKGKHVPECGKCFWCKEKAWALKENKIEL